VFSVRKERNYCLWIRSISLIYGGRGFDSRPASVRFVSDEWHWNRSLPEDLTFSCHYQFLSAAVSQCSILTFISMLLPSEEQLQKRENLHTKWFFGASKRFLGAIAKLIKVPLSFIISVLLSCQQVLARFPQDGFPWDFTLWTSMKICREIPNLVKNQTKYPALYYMKSKVRFIVANDINPPYKHFNATRNIFRVLTVTCSWAEHTDSTVVFP